MGAVGLRRPYQPTPPPDDDEAAELARHASSLFAITERGLNRLLRSAALDAQLDAYLAHNPRPRPDEDAPLDSPELD